MHSTKKTFTVKKDPTGESGAALSMPVPEPGTCHSDPGGASYKLKDTFYFSHDYTTRTDEKIKRLLRKWGMLGYGVFWAIVEDLYNNANALHTDYDGIAYDLHTDSDLIKSVINDFDLFIIEGDEFGSKSVERRLIDRNEKSEKARQSAFKRWNKSESDANAMQPQSDSNAIKERKGKEIKEIVYTSDFLIFWEAYPLKEGKKPSFAKWQKAKDRPQIDEILAKIELQKKSEKWQKGFIPMPETYINQARWNDEIKIKKLVVCL